MSILKRCIGALKLPALTAVVFLSMLSPASASTSSLYLSSFSASPSPIDAGGISTWTLGFSLIPSNAGEQFSSANLTFTSGDGQTASFSGSLSGTSASLGQAFTYTNAGTYFGSVSGTVVGSWTTTDLISTPVYNWVWHSYSNCLFNCDYQVYEYVGDSMSYVTTSHAETFNISGDVQGQLSTSWDTIYVAPTYGWVWHPDQCTIFGCSSSGQWTYDPIGTHEEVFTHTQTLAIDALTVNSPQVAAPVPEPETYAMLLGGLGLLGFVTRRRRQNS